MHNLTINFSLYPIKFKTNLPLPTDKIEKPWFVEVFLA